MRVSHILRPISVIIILFVFLGSCKQARKKSFFREQLNNVYMESISMDLMSYAAHEEWYFVKRRPQDPFKLVINENYLFVGGRGIIVSGLKKK